MTGKLQRLNRGEIESLNKLSNGDLKKFAGKKAAEILELIDSASRKIAEAKKAADCAREVKTGLLRFGATRKKVDLSADALIQTNSAIAELANIQRESIAFTCVSLAFAKAMYESLEEMVANGFLEKDGQLVRLNEDVKQFAQCILDETDNYVRRQTVVEERQRAQSARIDANSAAIENINEIDNEQETELARQRGKDDEHDQRLDEQEDIIKNLQLEIATLKGENVSRVVSRTVAGSANARERKSSCGSGAELNWYRSSDDKIFAGICAGLAHKFGINAWAIRIVFAAISCFCLLLPLIYIVLIFVLKRRQTKSGA